MRISDWSSDLCSSDLAHGVGEKEKNHTNRRARNIDQPLPSITAGGNQYAVAEPHMEPIMVQTDQQSSSGVIRSMDEPVDRKSVGWGKSVSVRVDLGGSRIIKKKQREEKNTK